MLSKFSTYKDKVLGHMCMTPAKKRRLLPKWNLDSSKPILQIFWVWGFRLLMAGGLFIYALYFLHAFPFSEWVFLGLLVLSFYIESVAIKRVSNSERQLSRVATLTQTHRKSTRILSEQTHRVALEMEEAVGGIISQFMNIASKTFEQAETIQSTASAAEEINIDQESIMAIRMMPLEFSFSRFPRMVRDTAQKLDKKVNFMTNDGQTELDRTVIEKISDPLNHLIRNAVDHGIETPEERVAAGKVEEGRIELVAFYRGGNVVIEIIDDGKGLDAEKIFQKAVDKGLVEESANLSDSEIFKFIFNNGFSTAQEVTDVSGRGVGMDVVAKNIKALNGSIEIQSEKGKGTKFSVSLPLTLAIVDGMATKVGDQTYIIPLLNIVESLKPQKDKIKTVNENVEVMFIRGEYIPLLRLKQCLLTEGAKGVDDLSEGIAIIVEVENVKVALFVDELLGQLQVVIKNLEDNYKPVEGLSGASILGDGSVALIIDLQGLVDMSQRENKFSLKDISHKHFVESKALAENPQLEEDVSIENETVEPDHLAFTEPLTPAEEQLNEGK